MPSLTRLPTGGVLNPLKNTTNTSHNELLHQDPLQPPLEPREATGAGAELFEESSQSDPDIAQMTTPAIMPMMSGVLDLPPFWGAP